MKRDQWGGNIGFVLAAAGSAIGLGNLWKFPYVAWENKGGSFVFVYLLCIFLIGMPIMISEILIGRRAQASSVPAFTRLGFKRWRFVGWLGVLAGLIILSFYSVIAGWSISSFIQCMSWSINGYETPGDTAFNQFLSNGPFQVGLSLIFSTLTALIVVGGIAKGIEKATKILMPGLFIVMLILVIRSVFLPGFGDAMTFLFKPDFRQFSPQFVLVALGQAFFTLSLGMGCMITYGSYMPRKNSIVNAAISIVVLDTLIALLACVIMYSIVFSSPALLSQLEAGGGKSSIGMLFVTIPNLFYTELAGGAVLAPLFYVLVGFAALSSTISLLEVLVALLVDRLNYTRLKSTILAAGSTYVLTLFSALSLGAVDFLSNWKVFGQAKDGIGFALNKTLLANKAGVLALLDHVAANWFLPMGGLFITVFVGWILPKSVSIEEFGLVKQNGQPKFVYNVWLFLVRFLAPLAILWIIYSVFAGHDFS
ncbi:MAG: sodium-dependent transporter [Acidobacteria bacterium]|nr:MAG: sodium-dependent transporter [Acidobacteriota bacterium]